jgi:dienelactone hydrolase
MNRVSILVGECFRLRRIFFRALQYPVMCVLLILGQACTSVESISYRVEDDTGNARICRPKGNSPFPAVIYNYGLIVDEHGYAGAMERGYNIDGICEALAKDGFLAFVPIRVSGHRAVTSHAHEVSRAIDFVKTLPEVDPSRIALMGLSRGGLITLMVGVQRRDLKSLVIMAPAPGAGHFERAVEQVPNINAPVLLMVEADDETIILQDFSLLKEALQNYNKEARIIFYDEGGGHRLFLTVNYYWDDLRVFLDETLLGAVAVDQPPGVEHATAPAAGRPATTAPQAEIVGPRGLTASQVISNSDHDGDARLSRDEFRGPPQAFDRIDADGDALLTREELEAFWRAHGFGDTGG